MNPAEMTHEEQMDRIDAFERALKHAWRANPCGETQRRYEGFIWAPRLSRIMWIKWVKDNAPRIDWCRELVTTAVTLGLGVGDE